MCFKAQFWYKTFCVWYPWCNRLRASELKCAPWPAETISIHPLALWRSSDRHIKPQARLQPPDEAGRGLWGPHPHGNAESDPPCCYHLLTRTASSWLQDHSVYFTLWWNGRFPRITFASSLELVTQRPGNAAQGRRRKCVRRALSRGRPAGRRLLNEKSGSINIRDILQPAPGVQTAQRRGHCWRCVTALWTEGSLQTTPHSNKNSHHSALPVRFIRTFGPIQINKI